VKKTIKIGRQDAFVLIDGQNDFIRRDGALYVVGIEDEMENASMIKKIVAVFRKPFGWRTATKDKHPKRCHIEYDILGGHCADGTTGQKVHEDLEWIYRAADEVLEKGMHPALISYSVALSPKFGRHIAALRREKIKRIFLVGWAFTHCVGESAITYAVQGFKVYIVRDLCRSVPPPYGDAKLMKKKLNDYGVKLINSGQIL
jgi:nicotinamidase-related amidase